MRLDPKFQLIAPSAVLVLIVVGLFYLTAQLDLVVAASSSWRQRDAYVTAVEKGQKTMTEKQAVNIVRFALDAEHKRTEAIVAARDTLTTVAWITLACTVLLLVTIRRVPRSQPLSGKVLFNSAPAPHEP
ncbi:MAG TPA: hypothetical protein VJU87_13190 [Gemmatimonadaceae bacterium]|nr:hypothetical protein [Gemmatimonadaceae bacterium]